MARQRNDESEGDSSRDRMDVESWLDNDVVLGGAAPSKDTIHLVRPTKKG